MGAALSAIRDTLMAGDKQAKDNVLQQLLFLTNAANARLDVYQQNMEKQFRNRAVEAETSVVGYRALRWERGYRVGVTKEANKGISEIIDAFFGKKDEGKNEESPILAGFKKVVSTALDIILGNTMAGEQEDIKWFVFAHHNAIIRIDVRLWRYNFIGKGVMAESENVFCYIFCTSVVKHNILQPDELIYLLSEHGGDENVEAYLSYLLHIWGKLEAITKDPSKVPPGSLPPAIPREKLKDDKIDSAPMIEAEAKKKEEKLTPEEREKKELEKENERAVREAVAKELERMAGETEKAVKAAEEKQRAKNAEAEAKRKEKEAQDENEKAAKKVEKGTVGHPTGPDAHPATPLIPPNSGSH